MGEHEGHASGDPMKQAWGEVAESISALGRQMKGRYRDHAAATDTAGAGEEDPTAEDTEAERAADEKTAALRAAFEQFVAAGKQVGERVTDVARDDAVKAQAKQTATSLDGALSATVDLITEQIEGLIGRAKGGRGASTPPESASSESATAEPASSEPALTEPESTASESTAPASSESPTWDPPATEEPNVSPPDGTTPS